MKAALLPPACLFLILTHVVAEQPPPLIPLTELGSDKYLGFTGGLYANGKNEPSGEYADALRRMSARIQPLDKDGRPDANGKIVVVGIGASVCLQIFTTLEEIGPKADGKRPEVMFINCAKGGHDVGKISDPKRHYWESALETVKKAGCAPAQVQVAWYQSDDLRDTRDDFPGRPQRLQEGIAKNLHELKDHFPNTRICYHSARHTTAFSPDKGAKEKHGEPRPYHAGWTVKWLIEEQSAGKAGLKFDDGDETVPLLAWAGYFWTDGDKPRRDGYRWTRDMNVADGIHLTDAGRTRVAGELIAFFAADEFSKSWFTGKGNLSAASDAPDTGALQ